MAKATEVEDGPHDKSGELETPPLPIPSWKQPRGEAVLTIAPHKSRLQVGEMLHLDVFLWNRSEEDLWVEKGLKAGIGLWVSVRNQAGEDIYYPRIKYKVASPTSLDRFLCLAPRTGQAGHDVTGDDIEMPAPGWYTVRIEHDHDVYRSRLCAACFGLALALVKPASCEVYVEEPR